MKAFYFLSAVCELGIGDGIYIPFGKNGGSDIKEAPAACVLNDDQYIFIYEME